MSLNDEFENWKVSRHNALKKLKQLADELDKNHRRASIAKLTGTSLGIVGNTVAVAGLLASTATFGVSLGLTIGGTIASVAGAATNVGTGITEDVLAKRLCREAEILIREDLKHTENLKNLFSSEAIINKLIDSGGKFAGNSIHKSINLASIMIKASAAEQAGEVANASKFFLAGSPILIAIGASASIVLTAIDVVELIKTSKELKEGSKSKHSDKLREIILKLRENTAEIEKEIENCDKKMNSNESKKPTEIIIDTNKSENTVQAITDVDKSERIEEENH